MASLREIKKRIRSAQNIGKVTKALQMISAVRMRKAQTEAMLSRPYSSELVDTLRTLPASDVENPLLKPNESQKQLIIIVAPDRGLAGSLITNLYRSTSRWSKGKDVDAITLGRKAGGIALRSKVNLVADYPVSQLDSLANNVVDQYKAGVYQSVWISYSKFINTMTQQAEVVQFLPVNLANVIGEKAASGPHALYTFEPTPASVLDYVITEYLKSTLNQIIKDATAAEHSARFVAMKNAHDNATSIVKDLNLQYNKTRQEKITNEISDIASAALLA
ncbi:MAG: ATP synthase F1 subunit gamma [Chloroflexota bacterium]|jgi:F-type H+-transporting ATPase subunit gamma|nr:ATP synthase F1 subunit gamma [Chloroflexota bacterium]